MEWELERADCCCCEWQRSRTEGKGGTHREVLLKVVRLFRSLVILRDLMNDEQWSVVVG